MIWLDGQDGVVDPAKLVNKPLVDMSDLCFFMLCLIGQAGDLVG